MSCSARTAESSFEWAPIQREEVVPRDGKPHTFLSLKFPLPDALGHWCEVACVATDITARKSEEADERRRAEFEQHLIGIVSHDLRSPLNVITIAAGKLLRDASLGERQTKAVQHIMTSARRTERMLGDLLDFTQARLGRGGIPIGKHTIDLHLLGRNIVDEMRPAHPHRVIELTASGKGTMEGDPDRVAQALINLLSNALSYSPEDTPVRLDLRGDKDAVILTVHNLGPPIPPELRPDLFEPLKRGPRRSSKVAGIGLGLFIVKHIVDAHGGSIAVESSDERGTFFVITLPRS